MTTVPPSPAQGETAGVSEAPNYYMCDISGNPHKVVFLSDHQAVIAALRQQLAELERQTAADAEILRHNMALANANTRKCMDERNGVIHQMREKFSAIEIADMCGLTRQRVHQILNEAPVVVGNQRGHQQKLSQQLAEMRGALRDLTDEVGAIVAFDDDTSLQAKLAQARALAHTSPDPVRIAGEAVPERGKCETCGDAGKVKEWREPHWPVGPSGNSLSGYEVEKPCPDCPAGATSSIDYAQRVGHENLKADCAQPEQLPPGSLANAIDEAQRNIASWPNDVRAAMGVQPERQGGNICICGHSKRPDMPYCLNCIELARAYGMFASPPPTDDIVAWLRHWLCHDETCKSENNDKHVGAYPCDCGLDRAIAALSERGK